MTALQKQTLDQGQLLKRQKILADFGEFALRSDDLDSVLTEACRLVGEALDTKRSKVLEIKRGEKKLWVRAAVGWTPNIVGLQLNMDQHSSETYAIKLGQPMVTKDIAKEERFGVPAFMKRAGVVALVNVPIFVPGRKPYGLLQVDDVVPRQFEDSDIQFLRTYATILGPVIDRLHQVDALKVSEERFRLVVENARDYAIFVTDAEDRIVDWHEGAQAVFGWTASEAAGMSASKLFTEEDRAKGEDQKEVETARREGSAPDVRWHLRKDGSHVFIDGSTECLRNADGSVKGFLKIGQNVTERHRTERRLRQNEAFQRMLIGGVPQLIWRSESIGNRIWSSPQWSSLLARPLKTAKGWDGLRRCIPMTMQR
ncbi:PAS domain S-box protein [Pararhizobium sp. DWP1-1-3]|uniref:PAS domain S-box protein n=1 Tax=Pararhizobium sp. DWP1-1-3 TaxID=2804652 RepID=UPI003CF264F2